MSLSNTNNHILTLVQAGNDAHGHLYEVTFSGGHLTDDNTSLSVRCSGFQAPTISQETYPVRYITAYIDRPTTKVVVNRSFPLTFRADEYWEIYKTLLKQQKLTFNPAHSYARANIKDLMDKGLLFDVNVSIIKELNPDLSDYSEDDAASFETRGVTKLFSFKGCWIEELKPATAFSGENSEPVKVEAKINFLQMEDWQSGLTGDPDHGAKITL